MRTNWTSWACGVAVAERFGRYRETLQRMIAFRLDSRIAGLIDKYAPFPAEHLRDG